MHRFKPLALTLSGLLLIHASACTGTEGGSPDGSGAASGMGGGGGGHGAAGGAAGTLTTGGASSSGAGGAPGGGASGDTGSAGKASGGSSGAMGGSAGAAGGSAGSSGNDGGASDGGEPATGGTSGSGGAGPSGGASGKGGSGGSAGASGASAVDVFGIRKLYPSASSGAEWTSAHWDGETYDISARRDPNDPSGLSGMRGDGSLEVDDGVLTMSGSQPRIYVYPEDGTVWRDLEITVYYQRVTDSDTAYAGLVIGARSGPDGHTDTTACDAHTYYARIRNDGAFDFEKELEHPASATQSRVNPTTAWPPDGDVPRSTWIGFKYVIYNVGQTVKLEAYRDMTSGADGGDWELVNETVDDGGWSVETTCAEHSPANGESDLVQLEGGTAFIRNTDVTEALYRFVTIREIAP
jgi:hypothetical protein